MCETTENARKSMEDNNFTPVLRDQPQMQDGFRRRRASIQSEMQAEQIRSSLMETLHESESKRRMSLPENLNQKRILLETMKVLRAFSDMVNEIEKSKIGETIKEDDEDDKNATYGKI